jgi:outer membrane lipoprotein SlyB
MKVIGKFLAVLLMASTLTACVTDSQNSYSSLDVGKQVDVEFGRVVRVRTVKVQGQNTGVGSTIGATAGGVAGSQIGSGDGSVAGALGGIVIGAIIGGIAEHQAQQRKGIEYTITKRNGKTVTIVQNIAKDDAPLRKGQRVLIQTSGTYMRVLPDDDLPAKIKKPADIKVEG